MKPIYIFRHQEYEGPGFFQQMLHKHKIPYEIYFIDQGEAVPETNAVTEGSCSALVFMGGPMSVNDNLLWIEKELQLIRAAVDADMPVLGHCLGGQLIAKALGADVFANDSKEIGWLPVETLDNEQSRDWLGSLPPQFDAFHWHGETFSIPPGATHILKSEHCAHQAFVINNTLAMQCHIEMTGDMVRQWAEFYNDELVEGVPSIQSALTMESRLVERIEQLQNIAEKVYERWLRPLLSA
ncbi:MAG: type 1 glutamine amidotransferase [Gammaproteobacteria bacterium]|jgi:GMP synthase-like glutamine amidotransferase|nr:type 1 glutamine amidotransferase [Gammaproteobacteria bacterium]